MSGTKIRPAVVVSADTINVRTDDRVLALITSNTLRASSAPGHVLIDVTTPDGRASGLLRTSVVRCTNLITLHKNLVYRVVGRMPTPLMAQIDAALKTALDLP